MEYKKFNNTYVMRVEKNEEIIEKIKELCEKENIRLGMVSGIGASNEVEIGLFNPTTKEYKTTIKKGMFEITSLLGNITRKDNEVYIHLHINIADETLTTYGGHLVKSIVSATGEIIITEIDGEVNRKKSEEIGLNLFDFQNE